MKIKRHKIYPELNFEKLNPGDTFSWGNSEKLYMKVEHLNYCSSENAVQTCSAFTVNEAE